MKRPARIPPAFARFKPLPDWIPLAAYPAYTDAAGQYSDARWAKGLESLYRSPQLEALWRGGLGRFNPADDEGWGFIINSLVKALECAPPPGQQRATKGDDTAKKRIIERQDAADRLLAKIADTAGDLGDLLYELEENGGILPAETYSSLALIREAIGQCERARAHVEVPFERFCRDLATAQKMQFPKPAMLMHWLSDACATHPLRTDLFADEPWLRSSHHSWKDYVRAVKDDFEKYRDFSRKTPPEFSTSEWRTLCHVMLELLDSIPPQTFDKGLKEL